MRKPREEEYLSGNLTAMIDVVFQLIIFFVCTTSLQSAVDSKIDLAVAPNGKAVAHKDPREIKIDVDASGRIYIARGLLNEAQLASVIRKAVAEYGADTPVLIRGDARAKHSAIEAVMNACAKGGIHRVKFAVLKEKGG